MLLQNLPFGFGSILNEFYMMGYGDAQRGDLERFDADCDWADDEFAAYMLGVDAAIAENS